ncbi:MAG: 4Fe-4S binding protein [Chloroflexota bacterium]
MTVMPRLNRELCDGCGLCLTVCRCGALVMRDNVLCVVETEECGFCGLCEEVCPAGAIACPYDIVVEES